MNASKLRKELSDLLEGKWPDIRPMPSASTQIVIYGVGNCGKHIANLMQKHGYRVVAFIDARAASIGNIGGIPCHAPGSAETKALAQAGTAVIIGIFNYQADLYEIDRLLQDVGFKQVISYYELNEHLPGELQSLYWLTNRSFYKTRTAEILSGFDLFDDEESREVYLDVMKLRLTYELDHLRAPLRENQYFLPELFKNRERMRVVDGGAFTGDSLDFFLNKKLRVESVAAFEPDLNNFKRLSEFTRKRKDELGEVILFPCGLDETTARKRFNSDGLSSSSLAENGDSFIQVVALDEVLPSFAPTLIKLDIEGAELAALRGARSIIENEKPDLAICVYHTPEHLWEVPQLMRALLPGHKLALRYHQLTGFDIVAYAYRAQ
jgi:FkbM family methyltransferase